MKNCFMRIGIIAITLLINCSYSVWGAQVTSPTVPLPLNTPDASSSLLRESGSITLIDDDTLFDESITELDVTKNGEANDTSGASACIEAGHTDAYLEPDRAVAHPDTDRTNDRSRAEPAGTSASADRESVRFNEQNTAQKSRRKIIATPQEWGNNPELKKLVEEDEMAQYAEMLNYNSFSVNIFVSDCKETNFFLFHMIKSEIFFYVFSKCQLLSLEDKRVLRKKYFGKKWEQANDPAKLIECISMIYRDIIAFTSPGKPIINTVNSLRKGYSAFLARIIEYYSSMDKKMEEVKNFGGELSSAAEELKKQLGDKFLSDRDTLNVQYSIIHYTVVAALLESVGAEEFKALKNDPKKYFTELAKMADDKNEIFKSDDYFHFIYTRVRLNSTFLVQIIKKLIFLYGSEKFIKSAKNVRIKYFTRVHLCNLIDRIYKYTDCVRIREFNLNDKDSINSHLNCFFLENGRLDVNKVFIDDIMTWVKEAITRSFQDIPINDAIEVFNKYFKVGLRENQSIDGYILSLKLLDKRMREISDWSSMTMRSKQPIPNLFVGRDGAILAIEVALKMLKKLKKIIGFIEENITL